MSDVMREVLDSLAKMGKQWGLGAPVGRVWGFMLFKSYPVTQREIEEGTGYSRGLISISLRKLERANMINVISDRRELHYSLNTSLTDSFKELVKRFLKDNLKPMIELLSETVDKVQDPKVRETFLTLLHEYRKLNLAVLLFSKIIDDVNTMPVEVENVEEVTKKISMEILI